MTRIAGYALAGALLAALAAGTRVPYEPHPAGDAVLRLSWRALGEPALHCRTPSAAEQAGLPAHMRRSQICERRLPSFRLEVAVDGVVALAERVDPAGARGDRAAVVLRELHVAPGLRDVRIGFTPLEAASPAASRRLEQRLPFAAGAVVLVSEDPTTRALTARGGPAPR